MYYHQEEILSEECNGRVESEVLSVLNCIDPSEMPYYLASKVEVKLSFAIDVGYYLGMHSKLYWPQLSIKACANGYLVYFCQFWFLKVIRSAPYRTPLHKPIERAPNRTKWFWSGYAQVHQETERSETWPRTSHNGQSRGGNDCSCRISLYCYRCSKQSSSSVDHPPSNSHFPI